MYNSAMRKLRTVAIAAYGKMHANRRKKVSPTKWPEIGYDSEGTRNHLLCPISFMFDKLDEERLELKEAALSEPFADVLKEAGDVTAVAMMTLDHRAYTHSKHDNEWCAPKVVCLCGSTRFKDEFMEANYELTMMGIIVLSVGFFMHADASKRPTLFDWQKQGLDELHKRKIDLSDEILVINVGDYIGSSTKSEIEYAKATGKEVYYRYPHQETDSYGN